MHNHGSNFTDYTFFTIFTYDSINTILERQLKLIWDFRGPAASKTAEHHEIHLKEYASSQQLTLQITGTEHPSDMHSIAFLAVMDSEMKPVRDALKPHRGTLYDPEL